MAAQAWTPYNSLTQAPTNLKEAIDWVLRVTGRDGKSNKAAQPPPSTSNGPHCLCYLAKAVKDLLYDARSPEYPGPSTGRNWNDILLDQEQSIVKPVLTDLGLLSDSTSAASTTTTCAGGTEVIKALIDQLAQGLQKWVGWQKGKEVCCLDTETGIGGKCTCPGGGAGGCCTGSSGTCTCASANNCYKSAYNKDSALWTNIVNGTTGKYPLVVMWTNCVVGVGGSGSAGSAVTVNPVKAAQEVHLLARIFLGSVCLIWSGLSQLGFLTGGGKRWSQDGKLHEVDKGLGSFMAAMGYDLDRLNQEKGGNNNGEFVQTLLTGGKDKGVPWQEFKNGPPQDSVAEYYSSIYSGALGAAKGSTEDICTKYPLLVLHILASGYFRAGSAGAKGVITPPKAATKKDETPSSRKPRTIREILYWLSALPYSEKYKALVERMDGKMKGILPKEQQDKGELKLHSESTNASTTLLQKDKITHYLLAACGYCPLVLIGIQGTIEKEVDKAQAPPGVVMWTNGVVGPPAAGSAGAGSGTDNKCTNYGKKQEDKTDCNKKDLAEKGQVCYGGYHLEVSQFGPLHGMYANGLFGFDMDLSAAQCLDQLRVYVYHCFYQLYFLRKQCTVGVESGVGAGGNTVLGWQSCRYGSGLVGAGKENWICQKSSTSNGKCKCYSGKKSPLMLFLCDSVEHMHCGLTKGKGVNDYPEIDDHIEAKDTIQPPHFGKPPMHCPVPMGWQAESTGSSTSGGQNRENHFKGTSQHFVVPLRHLYQDPLVVTWTHRVVGSPGTYPAHCTGNTLSHLLEYYCDPEKCQSGSLVVLLRLLACITPTVPRTLGDLFGFYYYIVYIGGNQGGGAAEGVYARLKGKEEESKLYMLSIGSDGVVEALKKYGENCSGGTAGNLKCLYSDGKNNCTPFLSPLSGQQYGQLSPLMAGTYLSWLVYLIEGFRTGLEGLKGEFQQISCKDSECHRVGPGGGGCSDGNGCRQGTHGTKCTGGGGGVCQCASVVSCTGVLPVLYRYGFGYGDVKEENVAVVLVKVSQKFGTTFAESSIRAPSAQLCPRGSNSVVGGGTQNKKCHDFLTTLNKVLEGTNLTTSSQKGLHHEINQLIYTTRLPWIFVLTLAWLVAVLYLAFGAIWPLDWTHMRSHCRGWFREGSLSPWEILMVGKKKGRGILEFFGRT
uniref:Variant erythrocyte surface antigen-1, beta subunit n=1 Tax=Babesia bovis TaxID=5865 RepID=A7AX16_BABBO|eukprot:XP_001609162.1 variant erythrocyte surface antigen-1, beta subunit [Babesia bovis T2Bo]